MQTPIKALQLILFTIEDKKSRTLLEDSLGFHPDYRVGDVIHILQPVTQGVALGTDQQYVVRRVKHIVNRTEASLDSATYVLLVEVVELAALEREDLGVQLGSSRYEVKDN